MLNKQFVHEQVLAASALLGWTVKTTCEERDAWLLAADEQTLIDVELWAPRSRVVLTTRVGEVLEALGGDVYPLLLQYNYLWPETGGTRMALDGSPGNIVAVLDLGPDDLEPTALAALLTHLSVIRQVWAEMLEKLTLKDGEVAQPPIPGDISGQPISVPLL